mgnify:CR=1 FL=1
MGRLSLNDKMGMNNTFDNNEYIKTVIDTCSAIQEMILPLCGKNAMFDLVVFKEDTRDYFNNVFSNDGIHVLKNIEFINPIQTFIANYIRYVAERVEKAAADGTSTAVYFTATVLKSAMMFAQLKNAQIENNKHFNKAAQMEFSKNLSNIVDDYITQIRNRMSNFKIEPSELSYEERQLLIRNLALTTSKGNTFIAECAVQLFSDIPPILYKYVTHKRSFNETDEDLKIVNPTCDFDVKVRLSANTVYNKNLGTEILYESCTIIPIPNLNAMNSKAVVDFLNKQKEVKPFIVLVNGGDDATNIYLEKELNREDVVFARYIAPNEILMDNPLEINVLQVVSGHDTINPLSVTDIEKCLINNVHCGVIDKTLSISNLFDKGNSYIHPSYHSEDNPAYTKLYKDIEGHIDLLEKSHNMKDVKQRLEEFVRVYMKLVCSRLPKLQIGGSSINHLFNINIVDDVLGVVSVAMKHGFVIDGVLKLKLLCNQLNDEFTDLYNNDLNPMLMNINNDMNEFITAIDDRIESLDSDVLNIVNMQSSGLSEQCTDMSFFDVFGDMDDASFSSDQQFIIQSFLAFDELFSRMKETLPKLIRTNTVIVKNGIVEKET